MPPNWTGPSAKKAKPSTESSSSEESSSEDEEAGAKQTKVAPAGITFIFDMDNWKGWLNSASNVHSETLWYYIFSSFYILAAKKGPAKAAATKAASSSSEDSSDSEEDKAPAKPAAKVEGSIRIRHSHDSLLLLYYLARYPFIKM